MPETVSFSLSFRPGDLSDIVSLILAVGFVGAGSYGWGYYNGHADCWKMLKHLIPAKRDDKGRFAGNRSMAEVFLRERLKFNQ